MAHMNSKIRAILRLLDFFSFSASTKVVLVSLDKKLSTNLKLDLTHKIIERRIVNMKDISRDGLHQFCRCFCRYVIVISTVIKRATASITATTYSTGKLLFGELLPGEVAML